jgi:ATP-binding cassette subfamily B protein
LLREIIDVGIRHRRADLVIGLAVLTAALALFDAGLQLVERRISSIIGEGLIFDLRAEVFRHIQEMPIAFFSRTQTGALISRLNNDVVGAQQAFTDLFSNVVGNVVLVVIILVVMFTLSVPITLVALVLLPVFLVPARRVGRKLGTLFQRGMELNAEMNMVMSERFNVASARPSSNARRKCATSASTKRPTSASSSSHSRSPRRSRRPSRTGSVASRPSTVCWPSVRSWR